MLSCGSRPVVVVSLLLSASGCRMGCSWSSPLKFGLRPWSTISIVIRSSKERRPHSTSKLHKNVCPARPIFFSASRIWSSTDTGRPGSTQRRREDGEVPALQQRHLYNTQNLLHQVRDYWRSQSYNALHYQQEKFENAVQEHQRVAYDQVEIAAALATSCTAAQMTSSCRDFRVSSGTRSSATLSGSRSYSRDDAERPSQRSCALPVKK